jgi:molecular chaperone IbpA
VTYDFAPLFRTAIGFDRLARLADSATAAATPSYPPYNIERTGDDSYRLVMAVAGFAQEDIDLTVRDNTLFVAGRVQPEEDISSTEASHPAVLYRGIAGRAFERRFALADHIQVEGAELKNGLLVIGLRRVVPEALKPRRIPIGGQAPQAIANDSATQTQAA